VLLSAYFVGQGINQSVNAIDSLATREASSQGVSYEVVVGGAVMKDAIYFWDELAGHLIVYIAAFVMQLRWMNCVIFNKKEYVSYPSTNWNVFRGIVTGVSTGIMTIEGQCVGVGILLCVAQITFVKLFAENKSADQFVRYFYLVAVFNLLTFGIWHFAYGSFVEPSHLHDGGWSMVQVVTFGAVGGRGPDIREATHNKQHLYSAADAPVEELLQLVNKIISEADNDAIYNYIETAKKMLIGTEEL